MTQVLIKTMKENKERTKTLHESRKTKDFLTIFKIVWVLWRRDCELGIHWVEAHLQINQTTAYNKFSKGYNKKEEKIILPIFHFCP